MDVVDMEAMADMEGMEVEVDMAGMEADTEAMAWDMEATEGEVMEA